MLTALAVAGLVLLSSAVALDRIDSGERSLDQEMRAKFEKLRRHNKSLLVQTAELDGQPIGVVIFTDSGFVTNFDPSIFDGEKEKQAPWHPKA